MAGLRRHIRQPNSYQWKTTGYWINTLNGDQITPINIYGQGIGTDSSNNCYAVGFWQNNSTFEYGAVISKYDRNGVIQWQKSLGTAAKAQAALVDASGNVYAAGMNSGNASVIKFNSSGALQWQRELADMPNPASYKAAAFDPEGNINLTGYQESSSSSNGLDVLIAKYDTAGNNQLISALYDPSGSLYSEGDGICVDSSGNYYVVGYTEIGNGSDDGLIAKYNSSNEIQWKKGFYPESTRGLCYFTGVVHDYSGCIYCCGYYVDSDAGVNPGIVVKVNPDGSIQWQKYLSTGSEGQWNGIAIDSSNNLYVVGQDHSAAYIAKINGNGAIQWQRSITGSAPIQNWAIAVDSAGHYYVSGYDGTNEVMFKFPTDGGRVGTYGTYTYMGSALTSSEGNLVPYAAGLTSSTLSMAEQSGSLNESESVFATTTTIA